MTYPKQGDAHSNKPLYSVNDFVTKRTKIIVNIAVLTAKSSLIPPKE